MRACGKRRRRRLNPNFVRLCLGAVLLALIIAVIVTLVMKNRPSPARICLFRST